MIVFVFYFISAFCQDNSSDKNEDLFSFVLMTDIHLQPEKKQSMDFKRQLMYLYFFCNT